METEKSTICCLRLETVVSLQSESQDLRTRVADGINPSARAGEDYVPAQKTGQKKKGQVLPSSAFCSIQALNRSDENLPILVWAVYFTKAIDSNGS